MTTKIAIVGATGETGGSIVDGLLGSESQFEITALVRPSSVEKPATITLKERGIKIVPIDLGGNHDELVAALEGIDTVISAIHFQSLDDEIPLSNAAKRAGVKRYVPCFFATIAPRGVMGIRDRKEEILDHIQRIYLPYTVIDIGWWYQLTLPRVPSGKLDGSLVFPNNNIIAGGNNPSALTDVRDIGKYVAAIVSDPRTINKRVLAYSELKTQNEIHKLVEKVIGEKPESTSVSLSTRSLVDKVLSYCRCPRSSSTNSWPHSKAPRNIARCVVSTSTGCLGAYEATTRLKMPYTLDIFLPRTCIPRFKVEAWRSSSRMLPREGSRKSTSIDSLAVYASRKKQYVMLAIQGKSFARLNRMSV
ncbi:hypothetical protein FOPG_06005 [Fusarium oxysporum f. sp. conglutinans race 2 54008]|uniref:NmrA-like domain-containing protein n=1 Tax=Fusarium oxysporum f. sp. conglutinans race 2 54008 TaxID=1089457 RepID=X0HV53_FUSOX|nr:hypothetical protein FOPG_06005 [Fusarium oxysporum f. sp. conglutinans race 2 54008]KAJ4029569.1 hypothetical protein NW758_013456 [Fusarium oxysporum]KAJ4074507.1 hypothetical protein NW761_013723 [Fusarium oxysporum]